MEFHQRLRDLIEENDITQKKLAADLNIAASTVSSYVQGVREPDFSLLLRLADYFHVSTDYLLGYSSQQTASSSDHELLCLFHSLLPEQREIYLEQGRAFLRFNRKNREK